MQCDYASTGESDQEGLIVTSVCPSVCTHKIKRGNCLIFLNLQSGVDALPGEDGSS